MAQERLKFYQTGSFAAGNRLLPADRNTSSPASGAPTA